MASTEMVVDITPNTIAITSFVDTKAAGLSVLSEH
jgi:hypothetical protein